MTKYCRLNDNIEGGSYTVSERTDERVCIMQRRQSKKLSVLQVGCPRNSVDTEYRLFFTSVYSVFRAELAKIPRNSAEFRVILFR
jgi:hypothetical protein